MKTRPRLRPDLDCHDFAELTSLLQPRSVAVIGASDQPGNVGGAAVRRLRRFGFPGDIWPVNPRRSSVDGLPCHPGVADLPGAADLAILAVPAAVTPDLVRQCAAAGTRHGIIWSGGFEEVGPAGAELQAALVEACAETGFAVLGPNCLGLIDSHQPLTATFASFLTHVDALIPGDISMVSQSGGLATMAQALAQQAGVGFRYTISSGNEAVLTAADLLHALAHDDRTRVVTGYLEGVRDGDRLAAALAEIRAAGKPVVLLKGGATPASAHAATAHTGAFAGEDSTWRAVLDELGVIQVESLERLLDIALFLSRTDRRTDPPRQPTGTGTAVLTFGGGMGVLSADQAARRGLSVPALTEHTRRTLTPLVPAIASVRNPVDLTPEAFNKPEMLKNLPAVLDAIAADPGVDILLAQMGAMDSGGPEVAAELSAFRRRTDALVCVAWPLAPPGVLAYLRDEGVHVFGEHVRAVAVAAELAGRPAPATGAPPPEPMAFAWPAAERAAPAGTVVTEPRCHEILAAAGLPVAAGRPATSEEAAVQAAEAIGYPVVLKGVSPDVVHRAAAGLVALRVGSEDQLRAAYQRLRERAAAGGVLLDAVHVQHMVGDGAELLVSAFRDPTFGVMVSCAAGGTMTELIGDVQLHRAPFDRTTAERLLRRLRFVRAGGHDSEPAAMERVAGFVADFSRLAASAPWQGFTLELNPVKWSDRYVAAVDGLLIVEEP
ncbi:acetate--CoA ligase family protein [Streptomyces sp. SBT349]|uniref:acetate--CoA ligase family protein n=1 Tax=Streptomyces sp. SBT349 TaxID=1580539 RepID=UPI00066D0144|nr:acetate--CoA ligase family protein [Streptomyces sp. SBT349]